MNNIKPYKECKKCGGEQWCLIDKVYFEMNENCRDCDNIEWEEGRLSFEEFAKREKKAWDEVIKLDI